MKKHLARIFITALCTIILGIFLPAEAKAASKKTVSKDFEIKDGVLLSYKGSGGEVKIPDGVTRIGGLAFSASKITSVTIPASVKYIDYGAFSECKNLKSITFSKGLISIGENAFYACTGLKSVTIPGSLKNIGLSVFYNCTGLESVVFSKGVEYIGDYMFSGCTGLKSVVISNTVKKIGKAAFYGANLKSVSIPNGVKLIDEYAFSNCKSLKDVIIPKSVTEITGNSFEGTPWLDELLKKSSLAIVNDILIKAKESVSGKVEIPAGVKTIASGAFYGCKNSAAL